MMTFSAGRRAAPAGALVIVASLLGGCISPATYGTGEAPELSIFREATGGFVSPAREKVDYKPRSPLVVPPRAELRPPESATTAAADPAWPKEPQEPERIAGIGGILQSRAVEGSSAQAPRKAPEERTVQEQIDAAKAFRAAVAERDGTGGGPYQRRYLTEPPEAYRQPSPDAPTQVAEGEAAPQKKGFFSRLFD